MPISFDFYKDIVRDWILQNISTDLKILDVGPGIGTYSELVRSHGYKMDAVEIWQPYIDTYELNNKYDNVYNDNILDKSSEFIDQYDFFILGDVLEHLSAEDGQKFIELLQSKHKKYLVAVPYCMEQGEWEGNVYETHLQPDLTPDIVLERYPQFKFLCGNDRYGYYINN